MSESKIQALAIRWFNNTYCLKHHDPRCCIFSVPNEATQNMPWPQLMKFRATGLLSGVSDTIVLLPGKTLFVEFKTLTGTQSKSQKEFQKRVEALGFLYCIVRSVEEFQKYITHAIAESK